MSNVEAVEPSIEHQLAEWLFAKEQIAIWTAKRDSLSEPIIEFFGQESEGSKTHNMPQTGSGLVWKIGIKAAINRKADLAAIQTIVGLSPEFPDELMPIESKLELDETGCKWLEKNRSDLYALIAAVITKTPGKTGVTVELVEPKKGK
jgi:hypothetical protein